MSEVFNYCHVAEQTDRGCKRPANEDWLAHFESPNGLVAVVCDGMGGHVGGQVASHVAVDAIRQFMMQERAGTPGELIVAAINAANDAILNRAAQQPELTGMGSTCVMLIVREGKVYIGSVGDSRVYLVRNHRIRQLTVDQSYVQMLVDAGSITKEEAERHPRKNEITNALGLRGMKPATVLREAINPEAGDCFLLCSDGLSGMVSDKDICKTVSKQGEMSQQARVAELIERAKQNGGLDNITCQIVEFSVTPDAAVQKEESSVTVKKRTMTICCVAVLVFLVAGGLAWWLSSFDNGDGAHSKQVTGLIQNSDTTVNLDSVKFEKGKVFVKLREIKELGVELEYKNVLGTITKRFKGYTLSRMEVHPKGAVHMESGVEYKDQTASIKFVGELADGENEIAITLYGVKDGQATKSKMLLLVPVVKPQLVEKKVIAEEKPSEVNEPNYKDRVVSAISGSATKLMDTPSGNDMPLEKTTEPHECTFVFTEQNKVFTLHSAEGTNTKTDAYFPELAFKSEITAEQDMGWYTIRNNGKDCILTIKKMPAKGTPIIEIPTTQKGVVIKVRIRPGK